MPTRIPRLRSTIDRDPGLQPERTALAWSRSALAMLVVALLCLRVAFATEQRIALLASSLAFLAALVMVLRRWTRPDYDRVRDDVTSPATQFLVAYVTGTLLLIASLIAIEIVRRQF